MQKRTINPGDKFNMLTVLSREGSRSGKSLYKCRCECGNISHVLSMALTRGTTKSCGCLVGRKRISVGQRFGRLTVIRRLPARSGKTIYRCQCDCGNVSEHQSGNLNNGNATSCGCYARQRVSEAHYTHGLNQNDPTYRSWRAMRSRCLNESVREYPRYGGRGITFCDRWESFENFLADMGERPKGKTLDRWPDNDGNYEPSNCRWATPKEQANNRHRRTSHKQLA